MKKLFPALLILICLTAATQEQDWAFSPVSKFYNDSTYYPSIQTVSTSVVNYEFAGFNLSVVISAGKPAKKILGYSKKGKPIEVFYFPGTSTKRALVIGGVHGSELSSVEVTKRLIARLTAGDKPYYSVIIIPVLFPDNVSTAENKRRDRVRNNTGRYTNQLAIDPNRQLPALGKPFLVNDANDAYGRTIEKENALLLQLIQAYAPDRIVSVHAIKDQSKAGIYADPRTDCAGRAVGYSSDSTLAVLMAKYIDEKKGNAFGNNIKTTPTALYYLDPKPVAAGELQPRNLKGMAMRGKIDGVSLGSWASTAVCDEKNNYQRAAMRILTIEFPGYKKPSEYKVRDDREWYEKQVELYTTAIGSYFLGAYCVEENRGEEKSLVSK